MKTKIIEKLGMKLLSSAFCLLCGTNALALDSGQLISVDGLTYRVESYSEWDGSGTASVAGYGDDLPGDVVIPMEVRYFDYEDGREYVFEVWGVDPYAFQGCTELTSLDFQLQPGPSIGSYAFSGCTNLERVEGINDAMVGDHAFSGCTSLVAVEGQLNTMGAYAFENCNSLEAIPRYSDAGFNEIPEGAFSGCTGLQEVRIDKPIVWIQANAFNGCTSLRTVEFPHTLQNIYENAFTGCTSLTDIYVYGLNQPSLSGQVFSDETFGTATVHAPEAVIGSYGGGGYDGWYRFTKVEKLTQGNDLAYDLEIDGLYYILYAKRQEPIQTGDGEIIKTYYDAYITQNGVPSYSGFVEIPRTPVDQEDMYVETVGIGDCAFWGCSGLTGFVIPNSVTGIGGSAFADCVGLKSVTFPSSITGIGGSAFAGCSGLESVTIPNSVVSIEGGAFSRCTSLTNITIPNSVTSLGNAFRGCTGLESVVLSNSLKTISGYTFDGCSSLSEIEIPSSVSEIGECAFRGCTSLTEVTMPNSVTTLGNLIFNECTGLKRVTLPNSITRIPNGLFSGCSSLAYISIPSTVTRIEGSAFYGCSALTEITIPESVTQIGVVGSGTFAGCTGLTEVVIPNSVVTLSASTFMGCTNLESVTLSEQLAEIDDYTFYNCSNLKSITIPEAVKTIGNNVFQGCTGLATIRVENPEPPTAFYTTFTEEQYADTRVTVPEGTVADYETADPWLNFKWLQDETGTGISSIGNPAEHSAVSVENGQIVVECVDGRVTVYDASGKMVDSIENKGKVELSLPKGVYIVKTGSTTTKIAI